MQTANAQDVVQSYIDAFAARDLLRCVDLYDEQATLTAGPARHQGKKELEEWHQARFDADLHVVRIDDIFSDGDSVTVEGVVTSNRLKAWRVGTLSGRAKFQIREGKIASLELGMRAYNPLELFHL